MPNNHAALVSVIIPTHNRASWVKESIDSVLKQTYSNHEIIVIDDGSTDNTRNAVASYGRQVQYIHCEHRGCSGARNIGMNLASGKYIAFLDSDDLFLPNKLEVQVELMEAHPEAVLSHSSYIRVDSSGQYMAMMETGKFTGRVYPRIVLLCPIATPTVMVRKDAVQELRFEESISLGEDIIFWCRIARRSPILGIEEPLTKVRIHGDNTATNPLMEKQGRTNVLDFMLKDNQSMGVLFRLLYHVRLRKAYRKIHKRQPLGRLSTLLKQGLPEPIYRLLRDIYHLTKKQEKVS